MTVFILLVWLSMLQKKAACYMITDGTILSQNNRDGPIPSGTVAGVQGFPADRMGRSWSYSLPMKHLGPF